MRLERCSAENTRYWLDRMRREVAAIRRGQWWVIAAIQLARVEYGYRADETAKATMRRALMQFDRLPLGTWTPQVYEFAQLCGQLSVSEWLIPELERGLKWLAQPESVYESELRERLRELAIQTGRADVTAQLTENVWPGRAANELVDACGLAGWARDARKLKRVLPRARVAIEAAGPAPESDPGTLGYRLVRACVCAELYAELPGLCERYGFPADEAPIALWSASDPIAYRRVRDGWLAHRIGRFREASQNQHWLSSEVRHAAETVRRLGDVDGYQAAIRDFREVIMGWSPQLDWMGCVAHCDLAVLFANADETRISAEHLDIASRLFAGKVAGAPKVRGSRSLMATIMSAAYRDLGEIDLALRLAKQSSHAGDRQASLAHALILGGRIDEAELELEKLDGPRERATSIGDALLSAFRVGCSTSVMLCRTLPPESESPPG